MKRTIGPITSVHKENMGLNGASPRLNRKHMANLVELNGILLGGGFEGT